MLVRHAAAVLAFAASMPVPVAFAARPFVTDDARIVDEGGCQIETFSKHQRRSSEREFWFLPGCTPAGPVELTIGGIKAGGIKTDDAIDGASSSVIAQAKTLIRTLRPNDFGLAATLGATRLNPIAPAQPAGWSPYFNLVTSLSLLDDRAFIHANIGALRDRPAALTRPTWGLGAEIALGTRLFGIVEAYGQQGEHPSRQIGLRFWVVPNRLQIDATLGSQVRRTPTDVWTSLGMRVLF